MSGPLRPPRPCRLCGNPTPTEALVETHLEPTNHHPKADVVVWLCVACAVEVTALADDGAKYGGGRR
jgi:hypothetical protein